MADTKKIQQLQQKLIELHPWHNKVDICEGLTTEFTQTLPADQLPEHHGGVTFEDKQERFKKMMSSIYRDGLGGKTFLDCGCNCGAYCFWAKELGAKRAFGFDVRDHWINQAKFLKKYRDAKSSGVKFKVCDLYDFPKLKMPKFDITYFRGIFYHLPDPIQGLRIAAEATNELIYVDTATVDLPDGEPFSGGLMASYEGKKSPMSGVYGLNWYPTGHKVMRHILNWMGFVEVKVLWHWKDKNPTNDKSELGPYKSRLGILASKVPGLISHRKDCFLDDPA